VVKAVSAVAVEIRLTSLKNPLDLAVLLIRTVDIAWEAKRNWAHAQAASAYDFFGGMEGWEKLPRELGKLVTPSLSHGEVVPEFWAGEADSPVLVETSIQGIEFRWVQERVNAPIDGTIVVKSAKIAQVKEFIRTTMWSQFPTSNIVFDKGGEILSDDLASFVGDQTEEADKLYTRLTKMLEAGLHHSCLLIGQPGAGKSTAIRQVCHRLGLRTMRLSTMGEKSSKYDRELDLVPVISVMKPDVLIIDDIDRLDQKPLLELLEEAKASCRIVLASANSSAKMLGAMLRPGRFDDKIEFRGMDKRLIAELSGGNTDVASRLEQLPLAYAYEYAKRRKVFGEAVALQELEELETRAKRCKKDESKDDT
jgi:hypothetical protein